MEYHPEPRARTSFTPETGSANEDGEAPTRDPPHSVLRLQQSVGNRAVQRLLASRGVTLQAKLMVGAADDPYEHEADRLAKQVTAMPAPPSAVTGQGSAEQAKSERDNVESKPILATSSDVRSDPGQEAQMQTKTRLERESFDARGTFEPGTDFERRLSSCDSGSPIPEATRSFMEKRFGADFSGVRLHTAGESAQLNRSISAQAFTHGQDIYLGEGQGDLESSAGRQLLAHELAHTIQQSAKGTLGPAAAGVRVSGGDGELSSVARQATGSDAAPGWQDQLEALLPRSGLLTNMMRVQTLSDMFGPELPALVSAISINKEARQFIGEHGMSALLALGETSPSHGIVEVSRARVWLATNPDRYGAKNIAAVKGERSPAFPETQGAQKPTFEDALREGADLLGKAEFGLSAGRSAGIDPNDGYDARDWEEGSKHGVLVSKVEPWMAINSIVKNIGKAVPKAGGGTTLWSFDCFDFVTLLRIYAYWRTLSRTEFNTKFGRLELGILSKSPLQWEETINATRPGERPFKSGGTEVVPGTMTFREVKIPVNQSWRQLVNDAPVGTQITWGNQDAKKKCTKDPNLSFCAYMYENTTKLGPDRYAAHPMGIVNERTIKEEMAKAVFEGRAVPAHYIESNIFISGMRVPIP